MKVFLTILGGLILAAGGAAIWYVTTQTSIPKLELPEGASVTEHISEVDGWFEQLYQKDKFNGAVLIVKNGTPLLAKGYGYTDHTKTEKITPKSSFRLASVSKQFTATGIMILKEQGKLKYDDLVTKFIPNFPYKDVSIRHLLNHTSGFPDSYMGLAENNKDNIPVLTNEIAIQLVIENAAPAYAAPNVEYAYSNTGYILLAYLIEVISQQSFEAFMQESLFDPMGMKNSRVWNLVSKDKTFANKTWSFTKSKGKVTELKPTFIDGVAGDGSVFSSIEDFLIWDDFWYGNSIISNESIQEAFKAPILSSGQPSNYGFGWGLPSNSVVSHNGSWLGARTAIVRNMDKKICIVLLDNSTNRHIGEIMDQLNSLN